MTLGSGIAAQVGFKQETTPGTAVTPDRFFEFNTEGLKGTPAHLQGLGLHAGGQYARAARRVQTLMDTKGSIVMDLPTKGLGLLLQNMIGSFATTAIQVGSTAAYKQVHVPGSLFGKSMTIQKGVPQSDGTVVPFTYTGAKITDWEIACKIGEIALLTLNTDAQNELTPSTSPAGPSLATASYIANTGVFHFRQGTVYTGGTVSTSSGVASVSGASAAAKITGIGVKHAAAMKADRHFFGRNGIKDEQLENAIRAITGQLDMEFYSRSAQYDVARNDTPTALQLQFVGDAIGSSAFELDILIPRVFFDVDTPSVNGPDVVAMTAPFTGLDDETNVPIQITYISTDTAV